MSRGVKHQGDAETSDSDRSSSIGWVPTRTFRKNDAYKDWQYAGRRKSEKIEDAIRTALLETPEVDYTAIVTARGGIWNFFRYKQKHQEYTNDRKGYTSWVHDMAKCARNLPELEQRLRKSLMSVFDNLVPEDLVLTDSDTDYEELCGQLANRRPKTTNEGRAKKKEGRTKEGRRTKGGRICRRQ